MTVKLLAFAGSTRTGSLNQALLDLAVAEGVEGLLVAAAGPHGVGVHPGHGRVGEGPPNLLLESLRAGAAMDEARRPTLRAVGRQPVDKAAAVADAPVAWLVEREGEIALRAADAVTAGAALHLGGEATAVQEEHHLAPRIERPADPGRQPRAHRTASPRGRVAEVHRDDRRQL